jgi:hypothetical protein
VNQGFLGKQNIIPWGTPEKDKNSQKPEKTLSFTSPGVPQKKHVFFKETGEFTPFSKPPFYPPKTQILPPLKLKFNGPGAIWKNTPGSYPGEFLLSLKFKVSRDSTRVLHRDI